jgi:hypothetical protein
VPFRSQNVQAAHRDHFVVLRFTLLRKLIEYRLPLIERHLINLSFLLEQHHRAARSA